MLFTYVEKEGINYEYHKNRNKNKYDSPINSEEISWRIVGIFKKDGTQ